MSTDTPIACSLSSSELSQRLDELSAIGREALLSVGADGVLRFRADEQTRARLEAIIAAESRCCSLLSFDLREQAGALLLTISAPAGAEPLALDLVNAFAAEVDVA
jgi:hypothetical protein